LAEVTTDPLAIIFDFDGLILDTEWASYSAWARAYEARGHTLSMQEWLPVVGTSPRNRPFPPAVRLAELTGEPIDPFALRLTIREQVIAQTATQQALPGVESLIIGAQREAVPIAVASSSSFEWVTMHLTRLQLIERFRAITGGDQVTNAKPDPELFLTSASKLGVDPARCVVLEDSGHGVAAAKAAGMKVVWCPNRVTCHLPDPGADLRVSSLAEVSLAGLRRLAGAR
jgi:beta-phosphoglucomutase-like phosphatase (HAD superfamily)